MRRGIREVNAAWRDPCGRFWPSWSVCLPHTTGQDSDPELGGPYASLTLEGATFTVLVQTREHQSLQLCFVRPTSVRFEGAARGDIRFVLPLDSSVSPDFAFSVAADYATSLRFAQLLEKNLANRDKRWQYWRGSADVGKTVCRHLQCGVHS